MTETRLITTRTSVGIPLRWRRPTVLRYEKARRVSDGSSFQAHAQLSNLLLLQTSHQSMRDGLDSVEITWVVGRGYAEGNRGLVMQIEPPRFTFLGRQGIA